jgi:hypothetical protein
MDNITAGQRRLVIELALGIARVLRDTCIDADARTKGAVYHSFQTAFTDGCAALWKLGCAHGLSMKRQILITREDWTHQKDPGNLDFPHEFVIFGAGQMRAHLAEQPMTVPLCEQILACYIRLVCEHCGKGKSVLPNTQDFFVATPDFADELRALAAEGYVEEMDQYWLWTDKIAPMMTGVIFWSEN